MKSPSMHRFNTIWRFLAFVRPHGHLVAGATGCGIIRYTIPLLVPWSIKYVIDELLAHPGPSARVSLHGTMAALLGLYGLWVVVSYARSYLAGLAGHRVIFDLRRRLFDHLQRLSLDFFERRRVGAIVSRLTADIAVAQNFVGAAFTNTLMDLACIGLIIWLLFSMNVQLALVSVSLLPAYVIAHKFTHHRIRQISRLVHDQFEEMTAWLTERMAAIVTVRAFSRPRREARAFLAQAKEGFKLLLQSVRWQSLALSLGGFLSGIAPIVVVWYGALQVMQGSLSIGGLTAFYAYLGMLYQPISRLTELNVVVSNSLAAMERIFEILDTIPSVQDPVGGARPSLLHGDVAFHHVTFRYPNGVLALQDVSVKFAAGSVTALIGPAGAGKSTLIKLLLRFYDVSEGTIVLDGLDLRTMQLVALRDAVAYVPQEPVLFSGTIIENIRYGNPRATDADVLHAAKALGADVMIRSLPSGYDAMVGERGLSLSGGQRQLVTIVRAWLKQAPIVVVDEPSAYLDAESEAVVREALTRLMDQRTVLIVAHRLSTIQHAQRLLVFNQGRLVEEGSFEELLNRSDGFLRRCYLIQRLAPLPPADESGEMAWLFNQPVAP